MSEDQLKNVMESFTAALRDHTRDVKEQFREQNSLLGQLRTDVARNEERQSSTFARVFGAPGVPGIAQHWTAENEARKTEITNIKTDVSALKQTSVMHKVYWAGIAALFTLLVKLGLSKAGMHF